MVKATVNLTKEKKKPETTQAPLSQPSKAPSDPNKEMTKIDVNPDKSVSVSVQGQTERLSPEKYGQYQQDKKRFLAGGGATNPQNVVQSRDPQIESLLNLEKQQTLKKQISNQLKQGATISQITKGLLENEAQRQAIPQDQSLPSIQEGLAQREAQKGITFKQTREDLATAARNPLGAINPYVGLVTSKTQLGDQVISNAAQLFDGIASLTGRKTIRVQQAEAAFADASAIIAQDIELVRIGAKDPIEAQRTVEQAIDAISRLEETTKGVGKLNLRFQIDKGFSLQAQIAREKGLLETQRVQLIIAAQEGRLAQAQANYGQ